MAGPLTLEAIGRIHANKTFLGVDGVSLNKGITDASLNSAMVARAMVEQTLDQIVCLVDHSKFDLVGSHVVAPLNKIDCLISDAKMPQDYRQELGNLQVMSIIA
jgi:DeoR/GlpR family transcriptional regulator of sugar metabolism